MSYDVRVLLHSSATIIAALLSAALTFNRLTDRGRARATASPTQTYGEGASEQTDIYGR